MSQFVGRHVAPEMLALGLLELALTFALCCIMLVPAGGGLAMPVVNQALVCALTVGFIAFTVGLYRPQMFQRARGLVVNTVLSALLSFPAVWLVSKLAGVSSYWPVGYDSLRPAKIALIWCSALVGLRFLFLIATRWNLFVHRVRSSGPAIARVLWRRYAPDDAASSRSRSCAPSVRRLPG